MKTPSSRDWPRPLLASPAGSQCDWVLIGQINCWLLVWLYIRSEHLDDLNLNSKVCRWTFSVRSTPLVENRPERSEARWRPTLWNLQSRSDRLINQLVDHKKIDQLSVKLWIFFFLSDCVCFTFELNRNIKAGRWKHFIFREWSVDLSINQLKEDYFDVFLQKKWFKDVALCFHPNVANVEKRLWKIGKIK